MVILRDLNTILIKYVTPSPPLKKRRGPFASLEQTKRKFGGAKPFSFLICGANLIEP
jgi:hypothetical protein